MYTKITGEFDSIEFAEFAAKHIKDSVNSSVKISIIHNRQKLRGVLPNHEHGKATHGNVFYLLPAAISSYNYITGRESRAVNKDLISEPLLNRAVTIAVQAEKNNADMIAGMLASYGGYNVKKNA